MKSSETFHDHVIELRNRFLIVLISVAIFSTLGYLVRNQIINFIHRPLGSQLYYSTPAGAFNLIMKISVVTGIFLTIPIILYNVIRFLEPALTKKLSKKHIHSTIIFSCLLAVLGAAFGYYVLLPMSLHFFGGYSSKNIAPLLSANEYFNYVINLIIVFAILFQIPLIMDFINRVKPFNTKQLLKYQKYVIVGAIIIAIILPFTYDPITQFVVAIPIIALYYLSVIMILFSNRQKRSDKFKQKLNSIPPIANVKPSYVPVAVPEIAHNTKITPVFLDGPEPVKLTIENKRTAYKYLDFAPASKLDSEKVNLELRQNRLKTLPRTRFIDGFRPIITT